MLAFVLGCVVPAFLLSVVCTALLCRWAPAWGLVDHPGPRKVHEQATPMGGGVALWVSVVTPLAIASLLAQGHSLPEAAEQAGDYLHEAIKRAPGFGAGHGPVDHMWVVRD